MAMRLAVFTLCLAASFKQALAQNTASVPSDLSSDFDPESISLQVSFDGQSDQGFASGSQLTAQAASKQPTFALGDSSGVNTAVSFLIMMIDTTNTNSRQLHFLQTDFKATEDKTAISSSSQPVFPYKGPGTEGESGPRQYSFLLYEQPGSFPAKSVPQAGQTIDVASFQSANGLQPPEAGVVMAVNLGSGSSSAAASVVASSTAAAQQGGGAASSATATSQGQNSVAEATTSDVVKTSTPIPPELATTTASNQVASTATTTIGNSPSTPGSKSAATAPVGASGLSTVITIPSGSVSKASSAATPSSNASGSAGSSSSQGSGTASSSPATQTTNAAPTLSGNPCLLGVIFFGVLLL